MAIELKFSKTDNTAWGFRLAGGADCDVPLTVVKVYDDSIAESAGLQVDDVIVRINNESTMGLTHGEVHDILSDAGLEFVMAVLRGEMVTEVHDDEENNAEVCNIMESSLQEQSSINKQSPEQVHTLTASEQVRVSSDGRLTDERIAEAISGETEVLPERNILGVNFNKVDLSESTVLQVVKEESEETKVDLQTKKWSTFLQKPEGPKIIPKKKDLEGPTAPPYRVIIKKQNKKNVERIPYLTESETETENQTLEEADQVIEDVQETTAEDAIHNVEIENDEIQLEVNDQCEGDERDDTSDREQNDEEHLHEEMSPSPAENVQELEKACAPLPLEEQLAQVQQQLQALAQLPSTIQDTLEAVTKQLAKIVRATNLHTEEEVTSQHSIGSQEEIELITEEETLESTLATAEQIAEHSDVETDVSYHSIKESSEGNQEDHDDQLEIISAEGDVEMQATDEIKEEEQKAKQMEIEKAAQQERAEETHQRRLEQRPTNPLMPIQRPIILPGGRKWSQPGDATPPATTKPQMTDEKICETLDTYSEIIVNQWNAMWPWCDTTKRVYRINFLKYQPPPKNLDYLQHSEVFKMVHDMEPPGKGIAARPGRVASEQDYYSRAPLQQAQ